MKSQDTTDRLEKILKDVKTEDDIREYMENYAENSYTGFAAYFNDYMKAHQLEMAEVIAGSNISRNYIYNIMNGDRNPGRDKIIALCIGAGMSCRDINRALKISQKGVLYAKNERDARIMIAVNKGIKNVTQLNIILDREGLEILE